MCLFCQIVKKEIPATVMFEDERILAFKDIKPAAPIHWLIIPKEHVASLAAASAQQEALVGELLWRAKSLAAEAGLAESGYKIIINTGRDGGQIIDHLHLHLLGGGPITNRV